MVKAYKAVAGKVLKQIDTVERHGEVTIAIRFEDDTEVDFSITPQARIQREEFKWRNGNQVPLRKTRRTR